jgi:sugar/nucleoside kinase (ribokinase family)
MNFWINGKRAQLETVLKRSDIIVVNDQEARELTGEFNLIKAIKQIVEFGPQSVIVKKGEHGAMLYHDGKFFFAPAYPLEKVVDPTGAGDSFAGGFMGYIAKADKRDFPTLKKAIIYGSTIASYNVEDFSFNRLKTLTMEKIDERVRAFKELTAF